MMLSNRIKALCVSLAALCLITGCSGRHCGSEWATSDGSLGEADVFVVTDSSTALIESIEKILRENMPMTDGSTSTLPLDIAVHAAVLGIGDEDAARLVSHSKTYTSLSNLMDGKCDLIIRTPISDAERETMALSGFKCEEFPVASEGFVFVVNAENPVDTLTEEQLRGIYSGKITNWSEVGGDDVAIIPYQRNADSGSQNYMLEFMGDIPLMEPVTEPLPATMSGILNAVANYDNAKGAIGYSVYAYSDGMYEDMAKIKYIKVNGVLPSLDTIADGSYPIVGYNYAVIGADEPSGSPARLLAEWMQSDRGQRAIASAGYVPYRRLDGVTPAMPDTAKLYTAVGTGAGEASDADYYYQMFISEDDLAKLTDEGVRKVVTDYVKAQRERIDGISDSEIKDFMATRRDPYGYNSDAWRRYLQLTLKNGYLSVLSGIAYMYGYQDSPDHFYKAEGAVFYLYTGKKLELSDLFTRDTDFVPKLNAQLAKKAVTPFSGFGTCHELLRSYSGLREGKFTFTADSIIFVPDDIFFDGVELGFGLDSMITSAPRDMEGLFTDLDNCIYRILHFYGSGDPVEYANGNYAEATGHHNPITIWFVSEEKMPVSAEVAKKLNGFAEQLYNKELAPDELKKRLEQSGVDLNNVKYYSIDPFPDLDFIMVGKRYIVFSGLNMLCWFNNDGTSGSMPVLESHLEHPYYFNFYFSAQTGEALKLRELFSEGWIAESVVSDAESDAPSARLAENFFKYTAAVDEVTVVDIRDYDHVPRNTGRHCGNYTRVMVTVRTENGGYYDISVPRKFIP